MNWIVTLVRNNSSLSYDAIRTFLDQTIPTRVLAIDNGSTDGASQMLNSLGSRVHVVHNMPGKSVAASWNDALRLLFDQDGEEAVLVMNNDVRIRPDFYETLLADGGGFVTGVGVNGRIVRDSHDGFRVLDPGLGELFPGPSPRGESRPHPDFSAFLIRRNVWQLVGEFDETFRPAWMEDNDYHVRLAMAGVDAHTTGAPFWHLASGTLKSIGDAQRLPYHEAYRRNAEHFMTKWGFLPATPEYDRFFESRRAHIVIP